ncbi:MAG: DUF6702 family protein [Salinimicrobium sp.]
MKKTFLLFLALLPLMSFSALHKFYVSETDVEYNEEAKSLQIISHVFIDDMEKLLKERYSDKLFLLKKGEHPQADGFIEKYLNDKLKISVEGKEREIKYLGKEYDNDKLVMYLEVENVEAFSNISVENTVLADLFPQQKNVIKVQNKGEIKSLLLGRSQPQGSLNFGK